ncbi:Polypyrimidine tract-binding protein 2 [Halotydeus destructor]|nr:Polypyrimidine tract-binding protein 2 [Halotydeus destructor]KAI1292528.1 Polypyrimidine tract-binding protein 2 [Halotydeus destructor]
MTSVVSSPVFSTNTASTESESPPPNMLTNGNYHHVVAGTGGGGDGHHHHTNGTGHTVNGNHNQPARFNHPPSKVVHIRNVPQSATETDLYNLAIPFGKIHNVLLMRPKFQAFVEYDELPSAQTMVNFWQVNSVSAPTLRGQHVYCQFSKHQELKPRYNNNHNHHNNNQHSSFASHDGQVHGHSPLATGHSSPSNPSHLGETPVVRAVLDNLVYPVSVDIFYQLFSRYGKVIKIVTFTKNNTLQALVQYENNYSAQSAKSSLDGQAMFGGTSNILRVDYSKLTSLNVKFNNEKSRDYTNPLLPTGNSYNGSGDMNGGHNLSGLDPLTLATLSGHGPMGFASPHHQHGNMNQGQSGHHMGGFGSQHNGSGSSGRHHHHGLSPMSHHALLGFGTVLLASNVPDQMANPDALFLLFGVYGDVVRVKVLFNKKDNALIQMAEPSQAQLAISFLNNMKLFGKPMRVTPSKHGIVQMPKEGLPDSGLTKDYSNSPLHRFKKPGSKNYSNIYPPSATLHLSNIPPSVDEDQIREAFADHLPATGSNIVNFKFFPKDKRMALLQLPSIEDAVLALIKMHNYQLAESAHLRVSFSKSSI